MFHFRLFKENKMSKVQNVFRKPLFKRNERKGKLLSYIRTLCFLVFCFIYFSLEHKWLLILWWTVICCLISLCILLCWRRMLHINTVEAFNENKIIVILVKGWGGREEGIKLVCDLTSSRQVLECKMQQQETSELWSRNYMVLYYWEHFLIMLCNSFGLDSPEYLTVMNELSNEKWR